MNQAVQAHLNANTNIGIGIKSLQIKNEELNSNINDLKSSHESNVEQLNKKIDALDDKLSEIDQLIHQIVNS